MVVGAAIVVVFDLFYLDGTLVDDLSEAGSRFSEGRRRDATWRSCAWKASRTGSVPFKYKASYELFDGSAIVYALNYP